MNDTTKTKDIKVDTQSSYDPNGSMPLLGLELTNTEKKREITDQIEDSNPKPSPSPLLGTTTFQNIDNARESSPRRSSQRICYTELLQENVRASGVNPRKTVLSDRRGCYKNLLQDLPKGVFRRKGKLYYRHVVPKDVQRPLGRPQIWRSLQTDSITIALRRLPSVIAAIESLIEQARAQAGLPIDATLLPPSTDDLVGRSVTASMPAPIVTQSLASKTEAVSAITLADAYRSYIDDPTRGWSASTKEAYETSRKLALSVFGGDIPLASISRSDCRDLLEVVRFLPSNSAKRFPKLTPREASDFARTREDIKIISAANANTLIANISSFLNWAVNEEMITRNPSRGLRLPDPVSKRDKRMPFEPEQLRAIFNAPLYRGCVDGERCYNKMGGCRPRNARFWVPLIALFTGARLGEICQLDTADIRTIDGVDCIVVSQRSLVGSTDKQLKTNASDRLIPVV